MSGHWPQNLQCGHQTCVVWVTMLVWRSSPGGPPFSAMLECPVPAPPILVTTSSLRMPEKSVCLGECVIHCFVGVVLLILVTRVGVALWCWCCSMVLPGFPSIN
jgi:hypothetical protein